MTVEQKMNVEDFKALDWSASHCQLTGCRGTVVAGGTRSELHGLLTLKAGAAKIRFRWTASQMVADYRASALMQVEQEYRTLPTISGVLLVGENGEPLAHEAQMKLAQAVMVACSGVWEAKVKYVAQLSHS